MFSVVGVLGILWSRSSLTGGASIIIPDCLKEVPGEAHDIISLNTPLGYASYAYVVMAASALYVFLLHLKCNVLFLQGLDTVLYHLQLLSPGVDGSLKVIYSST